MIITRVLNALKRCSEAYDDSNAALKLTPRNPSVYLLKCKTLLADGDAFFGIETVAEGLAVCGLENMELQKAFVEALDRPARVNPELARLFSGTLVKGFNTEDTE